MYGLPLDEALLNIPRDKDLLVVIGAEKVPGYIYGVADFNIAVGHQPHSEVAALAVFLDRWFQGSWQVKSFKGNVEIRPCERGKHVIEQPKR
jgi:tRNA (cytidine56-2'-O)-methyltransferase